MTIHQTFPADYDRQLADKVAALRADFAEFDLPDIAVYPSPPEHYRLRAEFKIWHEGDTAHYAMFEPGEYKKPFVIESFPVGSALMNALMQPLLARINNSQLLRKKLFRVEFLTTLSADCLITLIYHKPLNDEWEAEARELQAALEVPILGRSRKQKRVLERDYVLETMTVDGREYRYQQIEGSFTQPNGAVCTEMLNWATAQSKHFGGDLVELYCGNGNFTLPLSRNFERVVATELAKSSVHSARYNMALNGIENIKLVRMSSEEFSQAMDKEREFRRLQQAEVDLEDYRFSTIFVDPPRAGMDPHTTSVTQRFEHIIYVSCNPQTLRENLRQMTETHRIEAFAVFDQFPYTHHLECGVILAKR
ncbi:tRNA (uridine(54)-C5)-methyltransferase TrmA [Marinimicrobium alkaliphilum]|uniref:tRNA (uridine(54)-C5)-methyltransferase TrmA n=1 Tax=Marinimicrobium alkaliphilum TaxID=2202654 RepID=UPI000DBA715B|nr:tRNA (uridine(54)-C5)-methyltransferase TrmA [Marinimicrobium alkaliphilum]